MPRGRPLTPEQIAQAAAEYARTGSYADAGRAIGVEESVARRALLRAMGECGESNRVALHARAIERGMREGRRALTDTVRLLRAQLQNDGKAKPSTAKLVSVSKGLSQAVGRLCDLSKDQRERRAAHLHRQKTRAEIELLRSKAAGTAAPETVVISASDPRFADLQRQVFGGTRQGAEGDGRNGTDHGVAEGELSSLPAPLDPR